MQKDPAEEHLRVPLPGLLSVIWYVVFKMKAQGRAGQIKNPPSECSNSNHGRHS